MNKFAFSFMTKKVGMTHIFMEEIKHVPVTILSFEPHYLVGIKTLDKDGYHAIVVATEVVREKLMNKPHKGTFTAAKSPLLRQLFEIRLQESIPNLSLGAPLQINACKPGMMVQVRGLTKGKGFAGTVKRYGFKTQDATHGNSRSHRAQGSTGQRQTPGRVFLGKKMPGQMGNKITTIKKCEIISIDNEKNYLVVQGSIPGAPGSSLKISTSEISIAHWLSSQGSSSQGSSSQGNSSEGSSYEGSSSQGNSSGEAT